MPEKGVSALGHRLSGLSSFVVRCNEVSETKISMLVLPRIAKFHMDIESHIPYNDTAPRTTVLAILLVAKNRWKCRRRRTAREFPALGSNPGLPNFTALLRITWRTNVSDMSSQAASSRLQNFIEYCKKCTEQVLLAESDNSTTVWRKVTTIITHRLPAEIFKLGHAAFRLTTPIGAFLLWLIYWPTA